MAGQDDRVRVLLANAPYQKRVIDPWLNRKIDHGLLNLDVGRPDVKAFLQALQGIKPDWCLHLFTYIVVDCMPLPNAHTYTVNVASMVAIDTYYSVLYAACWCYAP